MPPLSCAHVDNDRVVDGDAGIPLDKLLLLAVPSLEGLSRTEGTLDVTLVEVPRALLALATTKLSYQKGRKAEAYQ